MQSDDTASFHWSARPPPATPHNGPQRIPAHVGGLSIQEHANLAFRKKHYPRTTCTSTPPPRSRRISSFDPPSFSDPKCTKPALGLGATRAGLSTMVRGAGLPRLVRQR